MMMAEVPLRWDGRILDPYVMICVGKRIFYRRILLKDGRVVIRFIAELLALIHYTVLQSQRGLDQIAVAAEMIEFSFVQWKKFHIGSSQFRIVLHGFGS